MSGDSAGLGVKMLEGVSAGASTLSTYTNARAKRGQALYNAAMADLEAQDTRAVGNAKSAQVQSNADRAVGTVKATVAGRGFTSGYGTANDVVNAADFSARLDALTIRSNTEKAVMAKRAESQGYRSQADSINPGAEATGTLLGQAGLLARRWAAPGGEN